MKIKLVRNVGLVCLFTVSMPAIAVTHQSIFPGNEAVKTGNAGHRLVTYPAYANKAVWPAPIFLKTPTAKAARVGTPEFNKFLPLYMIEADNELLECSEPVVDASVCRPSTLDKAEKRPTHTRHWLVLKNKQWTTCGKSGLSEKPKFGEYVCQSDLPQGRAFILLTRE